MKVLETIEALKQYNKWRRRESDMPMPAPREIGIAIDSAIAQLKKLSKAKK